MTLHLFGIKACDTMKKARVFLDGRGVAYTFHDYKVEGVTAERLAEWAAKVGWEKLLNRAGTTFRKLPEEARADLDEAKAIALMVAQPSMIKRPVATFGEEILVGFRPEEWARALG
ncbi:ArsC family reductase [Pinisolibacter sp.]|uniref:ArsC family reductase n=1 Tax=Pinisolibacter sp. TaxID=2172024 RepID=UPI002FDCCBBB